jgi:hypothetical protein
MCGGLAQKKTIQPTFSIGKACTKSGPLVFQLWILDLVCLWTMVLCLSLQTKNNNKKNGFDLKNVHISQKKLENKYVTIATMIICV